ncbi:MAG: cupin domain-containing protein [Terriglobales bacterium]
MSVTRREMCSLIAVLSAGVLRGNALGAPTSPGASLRSAVFPFEKLPVKVADNKAEFRAILKGKIATGESVEVHETTLPPGGAPHAPHRHEHSEMWLIREGTVEFTVNGISQRAGPGSLAFAASNDEHGIKNAGETPAIYFVVAIGPGAA